MRGPTPLLHVIQEISFIERLHIFEFHVPLHLKHCARAAEACPCYYYCLLLPVLPAATYAVAGYFDAQKEEI